MQDISPLFVKAPSLTPLRRGLPQSSKPEEPAWPYSEIWKWVGPGQDGWTRCRRPLLLRRRLLRHPRRLRLLRPRRPRRLPSPQPRRLRRRKLPRRSRRGRQRSQQPRRNPPARRRRRSPPSGKRRPGRRRRARRRKRSGSEGGEIPRGPVVRAPRGFLRLPAAACYLTKISPVIPDIPP